MKSITLAVMSDLHVGTGARSKDLCPADGNSPAIETDYRDRFLKFVKSQKLSADFRILPGDVSHIGKPSEFALASAVVAEATKALKIRRDHVIFVPGNHDSDWTGLKQSDLTGFRRSQRYAPLRHKDWIFSTIIKRGNPSVLDPPHYFCIWQFEELLAVGYNSSWDDGPEQQIHHGIVAAEHLDELDLQLSGIDTSQARIRLFLVHHHPVQYSDPIINPPDFSIMSNADNLLRILQKYNFDLLIHGHKHKPSFRTDIVNSGSPMAILCSGSFSVQLDTRWSGYVNNQFHLVRVDGRDNDLGSIYGRVESWTYLSGSGWVPSKAHNGMRHVVPFGTYLLPEQLKASLRHLLTAAFSDTRYVLWSELIKVRPSLLYLPPERTVEALDSLSNEFGFRRYGDPPDEIILVIPKEKEKA